MRALELYPVVRRRARRGPQHQLQPSQLEGVCGEHGGSHQPRQSTSQKPTLACVVASTDCAPGVLSVTSPAETVEDAPEAVAVADPDWRSSLRGPAFRDRRSGRSRRHPRISIPFLMHYKRLCDCVASNCLLLRAASCAYESPDLGAPTCQWHAPSTTERLVKPAKW